MPTEILPTWLAAQRIVRLHARTPLPSVLTLRAADFLPRPQAERIAEWYSSPAPSAGASDIEVAYEALADEVAALARSVTAHRSDGGLGVQVELVTTPDEPYDGAAELCADLRDNSSMKLRAASADDPHPLLSDSELDDVRVIHDVLGHAALGLGFDLQSEYAAWLYCRPLFSKAARPAAFTELVGTVSAYVQTGTRPALRADLPPAAIMQTAHVRRPPVNIGLARSGQRARHVGAAAYGGA